MRPIPFTNRYVQLGEDFYVPTTPAPVSDPGMIIYNHGLGDALGLEDTCVSSPEAVAVFAGNHVPDGAEPLAMAYSGHQFGQFNPRLGDGRALLLGQVSGHDDVLYDVHLKGSGRTSFSRGGDGRATLGPVLREYLVSEAMHVLGVPTTRALAAVTTGEQVMRTQHVPGGVITRVARSFVRVGTFEYFSSRGMRDATRTLADYVITHNYPECRGADNPYHAWFEAIIDRQAALIAQWMQLGFIHGVMNTDNMSIAGETIDYGPCALMDHYQHDKVYSSIDHHGRYAYNNQPGIGLWNLARLAESILPLLAEDTDAAVEIARSSLEKYAGLYAGYWLEGMRRKTGLQTHEERDGSLINELFELMATDGADFTLTFYYLSGLAIDTTDHDVALYRLFSDSAQIDRWLQQWRVRLRAEGSHDAKRQSAMRAVNPAYIPRNHQIEAVIRAAEDHDDFSAFHRLHQVLKNPFQRQPGMDAFMLPPEEDEVVQQTFCGT